LKCSRFEDATLPFDVESDDLITRALGTSFNVNAYSETIEITLVTGKVRVFEESNSNQSVELKQGEQVRRTGMGFSLNKVDLSTYTSWKEGQLIFDEAGYQEIFTELEKWYGVTISVSGKKNKKWRYSGEFDNQTLERVLERLAFTEKFEFEIEQDNVSIRL